MPFSSKFYHLLSLVDPFKEFVELERSRQLLSLRAVIFLVCCIGWVVYAAFTASIYIYTPEPSQLSVERIFPSSPPTALFQISIGLPLSASTRDPLHPTKYVSPFSTTLTEKIVSPYDAASAVPASLNIPSNTVVYQIYSFPVYGTVDKFTSTSTILYFEPCKYTNLYGLPLFFSVGDAQAAKNPNLLVTKFSDYDYRVSQPGSPTEFVLMYDDFDGDGTEIGIDLVLEKTVSSKMDVIYNASIFGPPAYSPPTRAYPVGALQKQQRSIAITIKPIVSVLTYSQKNILTLLGAIAGIFPVILSVGGIISGMIWSKLGSQTKDVSIPVVEGHQLQPFPAVKVAEEHHSQPMPGQVVEGHHLESSPSSLSEATHSV
jgi:hypothetical protein